MSVCRRTKHPYQIMHASLVSHIDSLKYIPYIDEKGQTYPVTVTQFIDSSKLYIHIVMC